MKIKRVITKRAYNRFKFMCLSAGTLIAMAYMNEEFSGTITSFSSSLLISDSSIEDMGIFVNAADEEHNMEDKFVILDYPSDVVKTAD